MTDFAQLWRRRVAPEGFVPLDGAALEALLDRLTRRLLEDDPAAAREVGAELVHAHLTDPGVLAATITTIGAALPSARLAEIQAAVAEGYAHALREATMAEQERLGRAVLDAHATAERALRASESRLRAIFHNAAVGIGVSTMDGRIVRVNQAFADLLGYTPDELCAMTVPQLAHPSDPPGMWRLYDEMIRGERDHVRLEKAYFRRDGTVVWTDLSSSLIRDDDGKPELTMAMVHDITDRRRLKESLEHQASHDPLTGLPNRLMIAAHLDKVFATAGRVGLCYLDLDGFKRINDTLGHQVGDALLVTVAERIAACADEPCRIAGRMSGDEFVLAVRDPSGPAEMSALAERLLAELTRPYQIGRHRLRVSASIGVVDSDVPGTTPDELMKAADLTLYVAKSEGKARFVMYDADRNARQAARYTLAAAIPDALDRAEFTVVYQPLVAFADERLCGVEALVRWRHPVLGTLTPDTFIPLAEETGVIVALGRHVLREACAQAASWPDVFVSVNVTVAQVREPSFPAEVAAILAETGLDPRRLVLELTESAVMDSDGAPLAALDCLAGRGIRIAIDDFGTGYSNLAYLRRLPIHILKLAGPFVDGLRESSSVDEQIVRTIVTLAHALQVTVTAEAVETRDQADRLRELGCDTAQGYLFSRPLPPESLIPLLRGAACAAHP
ncbi:diguanylate cyclase (GGDEF)-like protein/PAS domain S-box-containing protein [Actinoplanes octamycinicus]|uniref:Diguanylate cyclase (GGDEF)-like protein/PAS domain S-box-containing protein n=1 Tax=Actinoplanes octamycinicus TaxID=135948 RepID=A0A7W7MCE8_9ACTN|nr:EAL domain-containing protein [Actinoplanes octamycinicus]MBB4745082.1 diguanylate cyclase (GGDEF)-like protein/PAS domain S-box-containing protein [Actinoplanes octamycinicus]GIE55668.1 GGDEF domain-containing protein [Actinoplanes octamycinicus]